MNIFPNDRPITFRDVSHLSLFEGKHRLIIGGELLCKDIFGEHSDRLCVQMHPPLLPTFRLGNIDYVVAGLMSLGLMLSNSLTRNASPPEHSKHDVISFVGMVRCLKHLIDLLLLEVVGDVLHECRKMMLAATTIAILSVVLREAQMC